MNLMKWIQEIALSVGMLIAFGLVLYYRYPKLSRGLNKIFKLGSKKKDKKDSRMNKELLKYSSAEMIDIIQGTINRYRKNKEYKAEDVIERIKEIVG